VDYYGSAGVQHIAMRTGDIISTVSPTFYSNSIKLIDNILVLVALNFYILNNEAMLVIVVY